MSTNYAAVPIYPAMVGPIVRVGYANMTYAGIFGQAELRTGSYKEYAKHEESEVVKADATEFV